MIWLGVALALASAMLVNLGFFVEHRASSGARRLSLRHPLASAWQLLTDRLWLAGYAAGWLGWGAYVAALWFAPLTIVQGLAAGGIGVLALLVWRAGRVRPSRVDWWATTVAVAALVVLSATVGVRPFAPRHHQGSAVIVAVVVLMAVGAAAMAVARRLAGWGSALGALAGACYAVGDVSTKAAVDGDGWWYVVLLVAANATGFFALQLAFQRGSALATAGVASVLTNAAPIVVAIAVFGETLPRGGLGLAFVLALAGAVAGAAVLAGSGSAGAEPARPAGASGPVQAESVGAAGEALTAGACSPAGGRRAGRRDAARSAGGT